MRSKRLTTCLTYLTPITVLYDVGTDHGYLAIEAVTRNIVEKAYAVDNKKGPLNRAKNAIETAGLTQRIIPVLSHGIDDLPDDADGCVIAGLGGKTIVEILDGKAYNHLKRFIIQPNNNAHLVRKLTHTNTLKIVDETLVLDDGIIYPILILEPGSQTLNTKDIAFGPILRHKDDPLFKGMVERDIAHLTSVISTIPPHVDKTKHLKVLTLMKEVLDDYTRRH